MLFNSPQFLVFFVVVTALYFCIPARARAALLLAASTYFYMAFIPKYVLILYAIIVIDYAAAHFIAPARGGPRKLFLGVSVAANIGILVFFKYFNFLGENLSPLFSALGLGYLIPHLDVILPIGLSFHTFQALSYTFEVYYGRQAPERNFLVYALYVMYYPQLVAGPIERPQNLLPQFHAAHRFDYQRVVSGLSLMLWGFFKKVAIADRLAVVVNQVFAEPEKYPNSTLWIAAYFFTFQIFCDFSGYSDIALGASRVMGIELMRNFDRPYFSKNISEFWKRWHISLSTWFRDYLYIPLGGNRRGKILHYRNLLVVFLVSGLWHGANWTFVVWGGIHGAALCLLTASESWRHQLSARIGLAQFPRVARAPAILLTFHVAVVAWVYFRAGSVQEANHFIARMFGAAGGGSGVIPVSQRELAISLFLLLVLNGAYVVRDLRREYLDRQFERLSPVWRVGIAYSLITLIACWGKFDLQQFIYFQF